MASLKKEKKHKKVKQRKKEKKETCYKDSGE